MAFKALGAFSIVFDITLPASVSEFGFWFFGGIALGVCVFFLFNSFEVSWHILSSPHAEQLRGSHELRVVCRRLHK
jgi:hypothetical protein